MAEQSLTGAPGADRDQDDAAEFERQVEGLAVAEVNLLEAGDVGAGAGDGETGEQGEAGEEQAVAAGVAAEVADGAGHDAEQDDRHDQDERAAEPAAVFFPAEETDQGDAQLADEDLEVELFVEPQKDEAA